MSVPKEERANNTTIHVAFSSGTRHYSGHSVVQTTIRYGNTHSEEEKEAVQEFLRAVYKLRETFRQL